MKKICLFLLIFCSSLTANAADLLEVYQQALVSDPIFQQAISERLATREGVPISLSALLPNIQATANPSITRSAYSGTSFTSAVNGTPDTLSPRNNTQRAYTLALTITQTVFDFAQFSMLASQLSIAKEADAKMNSALQDLMIRVSAAYFAILRDEDNLSYSASSKSAYARQLDQTKHELAVGLKTLTDVYTAQASYDAAVADYITAQSTLANDRENLRAMTGVYYPHLAKLSEHFPLLNPEPADIEMWVKKAVAQNWLIKASQYNVESARQIVRQQFAGHLPTVNIQGTLNREFTDNLNGYMSLNERNGPGTQTDRMIQLNISMPIFSGGGVTAKTNQATYRYQGAQQQLEQTVRGTANMTRQSFLNILSGASKIKADKETMKSSKSSLDGMKASYEVGTETLVNVLNQQLKVFEAQIEYAKDRYAFVNNILVLKQAAGTLSFDDLHAINQWLK